MSFAGIGIWTHPENVGEITCPFCGGTAPVRRNKRGLLYYYCAPGEDRGDGCGMITPNLRGGQFWMLDHGRIYAPGEQPAALVRMAGEITEKAKPAARETAPAPAAKPAARKAAPPANPTEKPVNGKPDEKPAAKPRRLLGGLI